MNPATVLELFSRPDFLQGLVVGVVALVVLLLGLGRIPWGFGFAVAAGVVLAREGRFELAEALWPGWAPYLVLVVALGAGWGASQLSLRLPPWLVVGMFAVTVVGVWGTVPDTEHIRGMLGVAVALVPGVIVARPGWLLGLGVTTGAMVMGVAAVAGGAARPGSIVGALACLGLLLLGAWPEAEPGRPADGLVAAALHSGLVLVAARIAGRVEDPASTLVIVTVAFIAAGMAWQRFGTKPTPARVPPQL